MIYSMTGYGRGTAPFEGGSATVELKSVNNRFLDCSVRCSRTYMFLEEPVKSAIKAAGISRGKIDVSISIEYIGGDMAVTLNENAAREYIQQINSLSDKFELKNDISAMRIATMPEVMSVTKKEEDSDSLTAVVLNALSSALENYNTMRAVEGNRLASDILAKAENIETMKNQVVERMPDIVAEYRNRLFAKLKDLLADKSIDESRILTEAAVFADKVATDEETVRLTSHLQQLKEILSSGGSVGRKLDFLVQEINREINTIGSKGNDLTIANLVIDMKCELEKIREQIQNLE